MEFPQHLKRVRSDTERNWKLIRPVSLITTNSRGTISMKLFGHILRETPRRKRTNERTRKRVFRRNVSFNSQLGRCKLANLRAPQIFIDDACQRFARVISTVISKSRNSLIDRVPKENSAYAIYSVESKFSSSDCVGSASACYDLNIRIERNSNAFIFILLNVLP